MKITSKIVQSGLVDRTTISLLRKWGQFGSLAEDKEDKVQAITNQALQEFVEDIEKLIERDAKDLRETRLEVVVKEFHDLYSKSAGYFSAVEDTAGFLYAHCKHTFKVGELIFKDHHSASEGLKEKALFEVEKVEFLYENEKKHLKQLTVCKLGD